MVSERRKIYNYEQILQEYSKNNNLKSTLDFMIKQYKKTLKNVSTESKK